MQFNGGIKVFGDERYRGPCPTENAEQITFFARIRKQFPLTYGLLAIHVKNEGKRTYAQAAFAKAGGQTKGASDIMIPGSPAFVCELKRRDHTLSSWQTGQEEYLLTAKHCGAFACVALGVDAATEAFKLWRSLRIR